MLRIDVEPGLMRVDGTSTVSFAPGVATDRIVFRLWPNSPFYARRGARLTVDRLRAAGRPLAVSRPDPTTLVVRRALAARKRVTISMRWTLRLPRAAGLQLHGGNSLRLVSFFPSLAWNGSGWATEPPVRLDSFWPTSPTSDFDVHLTAPAEPHETAHQWFASLVGNDQSRDPWLSEGLATWAQAGLEQSLAAMLGTTVPSPLRNRIGEPMRFWQSYDFEAMRRGLYVQSA